MVGQTRNESSYTLASEFIKGQLDTYEGDRSTDELNYSRDYLTIFISYFFFFFFNIGVAFPYLHMQNGGE